MEEQVSKERLHEVMREVLASVPDGHSYWDQALAHSAILETEEAACVYFTYDEGKPQRVPMCLVGQVLDRLGWLGEVHEVDENQQRIANTNLGERFAPDALDILQQMQDEQDVESTLAWRVIAQAHDMA